MSTKYIAQKNDPKIDWARIGLGQKLDSQVARETGVPRRRVAKIRAKLGIPAYSKTHPNPRSNPVRRTDAAQPATKPITQVVAQTPVSAAPVAKPPKAAKPKKAKLKNYIALVIDRSGSMAYIQQDVLNVYADLVRTIKANAESQDQDTSVSVFTFANKVVREVSDTEAAKLDPSFRYYPDGLTALWDGVGEAIDYLKAMPDANEDNVSFLVIAITDGEENNSRNWTATRLNQVMKDVQQTDRWSLTFQVPPGQKSKLTGSFSIPSDNVREWQASSKGIREAGVATNSAIGQYYNSRASGQTSVQNFYVTTDLSRVSTKDIKTKLDDISDRFKDYTLEKEYVVKEAMETKTRKPYVIGAVYYELMKPEEIQPQKEVLIVERGKKAIWGGDQARQLIGLPKGVSAKVKPGNHSNYQIFVQSSSVNRILPRGTRILVDTTKLVDSTPTWDHTKAVNTN